MAKSRRASADDTPPASTARPRAGRRGAERPPKPADGQPALDPDPSLGAPDQFARQDPDSSGPQDFSPASKTESYESTPSEPNEHEIRLRAYHLYLDRGALDGADFDDWLQAEIELKKR